MVTKRALSLTPPDQTLSLRLSLPTSTLTPRTAPLPQKYPAKAHCRSVAKRLPRSPSRALFYLPSQRTLYAPYSDQPLPFRQLRHFYYLSGCPLADSHITYDCHTRRLTLYIPPLDPRDVLWTGLPPSREECKALYAVDDVKFSDALRGDLEAWVAGTPPGGGGGVVYCLDKASLPPPPEGVLGLGLDEEMGAEGGWGWRSMRGVVLDVEKLRLAVDTCRVYKDAYEVGLLRKAIDVTRMGHLAVMELLRKERGGGISALTEADLEAVYRAACVSHHAKNQAYDPIVCSGRACATLHYTANDAPLAGKQLLLIDAGAEWACYAADITRTYPLSGRFTREAQAVYDVVDRMQRECIARTVAGVSWRETHFLAARIAIEGLLDLGVFRGGREMAREIYGRGTWRAFYPHGLGHMLGLETHDVEGTPDDNSGYDPHALGAGRRGAGWPRGRHVPRSGPVEAGVMVARRLRPNMVLTVEPGIYFCEQIIRPYLSDPKHKDLIDAEVLEKYWDVGGVRIEDVVLVGKRGEGNEVLSKVIPRGW